MVMDFEGVLYSDSSCVVLLLPSRKHVSPAAHRHLVNVQFVCKGLCILKLRGGNADDKEVLGCSSSPATTWDVTVCSYPNQSLANNKQARIRDKCDAHTSSF
ncbi:hypothetical protein BDQ17DRAFT_1431417 [Cyathus striatus]|nr:hypothetical protein BDQ17DRAFT_1431417 [Cyathus striatus]